MLTHRVSITMEVDFCVAALEEAIARHGKPEIMNTDQGSQFTSLEFTDTLRQHDIAISMDGRGCWRDNVFVERPWKSIKYEDVYLKAYETASAARAGLAADIDFSTPAVHALPTAGALLRRPITLPCRQPGWQPEPPEHGLPLAACVRRKRRRRRG